MLINLSNHPSNKWTFEQLKAAESFGHIVDLPFPEVNPMGDEIYIDQLVNEYFEKVRSLSGGSKAVVHIMGEMTFTYALINKLKKNGIECLASTTERIVNEFGNGQKNATFRFVLFRKYID